MGIFVPCAVNSVTATNAAEYRAILGKGALPKETYLAAQWSAFLEVLTETRNGARGEHQALPIELHRSWAVSKTTASLSTSPPAWVKSLSAAPVITRSDCLGW